MNWTKVRVTYEVVVEMPSEDATHPSTIKNFRRMEEPIAKLLEEELEIFPEVHCGVVLSMHELAMQIRDEINTAQALGM